MGEQRLGVVQALSDGRIVPGDVVVGNDGRITALGVRPLSDATGTAAAGFVDLQVNGFGGVSFTACGRDGYERAALALARCGVTSYLVTIPTAHPDSYASVLSLAASVIADPPPGARPIGVHLEGPFLSRQRRGAHHPEWIRPPDVGLARHLCSLAPIVVMTLAPELEGARDVIEELLHRGVVVSAGHTDAVASEAREAFDRGVSMVTHLWNAQRQVTSREPGLAGVALTTPGVHTGLIADGIHLSPETLRISIAAAGQRAFLVSDAVSVAGLPDGVYAALGSEVTLRDGAVRLADGTLAGAAAGLDVGVRTLAALGIPVELAIGAATSSPAAALGRADLGSLQVGGPADIVVLGPALEVERTYVAGVLTSSG